MVNDHWKEFYDAVSLFTNIYAIIDKEHGTNYGCPFCQTNETVLQNFDEVVFQNSNEDIFDFLMWLWQ